MKLSQLKNQLSHVQSVNFELPDGKLIPPHFHVTEVGQVSKHFIDCGGTVRHEKTVSLQLWNAGDVDHRLLPGKLAAIIDLSEKVLNIEDGEIEVEYQSDTIGRYGMEFNGQNFLLTSKKTACLASDRCGSTAEKQALKLSELQTTEKGCCTPGGGCC